MLRRGVFLIIHLEPSEEYVVNCARRILDLREKADEVIDSLHNALERLETSGWSRELPIRKVGANKYEYVVHAHYQVTFQISDQIPPNQPPQEMWLELLTFEALS